MRITSSLCLFAGITVAFATQADPGPAQIPAPRDPCTIYKNCRSLTAGEKRLARSYYQKSIVYDDVRIINGRYLGIFPIGNYTGMSPDGNIYAVAQTVQSQDYSKEPEKAHFFIHELFHIKQRNEGLNILGQAFSLHAMRSGNPYAYRLKPGQPAHAYNFEQQARMAEHAYILGENLRSGGVAYKAMTDGLTVQQKCHHWSLLKETLATAHVRIGSLPALCR